MLSLQIIRFCGKIAVFGVRFLAVFLRVFRRWEPCNFVELLHSEPWSSCMSELDVVSGIVESSETSVEVEAGAEGATVETAEEERQGDPSW